MKIKKILLVVSSILLALAVILALSLSIGFGLIVHAVGASGLAAALVGLASSAVIAVVLFYATLAIAGATVAQELGLLAYLKAIWDSFTAR